MPTSGDIEKLHPLLQVVEKAGIYPLEAYQFVQEGLSYTVNKVHGCGPAVDENHHVSGQQLSEGLRDYALQRWGLLARVVLRRWNITSTLDFGRIVFALVAARMLKTTENDRIEDFRNVFDFRTAFDAGYRIESKV